MGLRDYEAVFRAAADPTTHPLHRDRPALRSATVGILQDTLAGRKERMPWEK